jgi:hypothetical protein
LAHDCFRIAQLRECRLNGNYEVRRPGTPWPDPVSA